MGWLDVCMPKHELVQVYPPVVLFTVQVRVDESLCSRFKFANHYTIGSTFTRKSESSEYNLNHTVVV